MRVARKMSKKKEKKKKKMSCSARKWLAGLAMDGMSRRLLAEHHSIRTRSEGEMDFGER